MISHLVDWPDIPSANCVIALLAKNANTIIIHLYFIHNKLLLLYGPRYEKTGFFAYAKIKTQISCAVIAQLISAFVFAT